jgi:formiminoglutamate deiminase
MRPIAVISHDAQLGRMLVLPGFVTAHSHAFQRGLRGRTQRNAGATGTFWSWRDAMYALAASLTPDSIHALSRRAFDELARAGVVAVGEFHYVHHQPDGTPYEDRTLLADCVIRAALDAGLAITLLRVAYARAGQGRPPEGPQKRFSDADADTVLRDVDALRARWSHDDRVRVGIAPHSVRAVPREWLGPLAQYARTHALPMHMHVAEQQGEVDACIAEHGRRPVELLADAGVLYERFCAVHATCVSDTEAQLLGRARAHACICPTTERDLGDGLADLAALRAHGVTLSVGVDSHVVSDHLEEVRALETHERLRVRRRVTFEPPAGRTPAQQLLLEGSAHGACAIGFDARIERAQTDWPADTLVALDRSPSLEGVADDDLPDAVVFSGTGLPLAGRWRARAQ